MERDQRLVDVLVEFAHTLGTDFALEEILDRLVGRAIDLLPISAAGVMLMSADSDLHFMAASTPSIMEVESLQREFDEGPCLEAFRTGNLVSVPDLAADQHFPRYSPHAVQRGVKAVFTLPLRLGDRRLGALDLYRATTGELAERDWEVAQVLADVASAYVFNAQARKTAAEDLASARHRSLHDPLTGLPNRTFFAELLERAVSAGRQSDRWAALLFVDLDRFKSVNDRFGHHVGDLLLMGVAMRFRAALRPGDILARLSGDEFVILCVGLADPADAEGLAERVARCLADPFDVEGRAIAMTASVGIAVTEPGAEIPESLLHDADFAMYEAKAAGGAHHRVVDRSARRAADQRAHLEAQLLPALRRGELTLAYQPICRAKDGLLVGVEALLRWHHPTKGWVPPEVVVPIAERTGAIVDLGRWVMEQACRDFVRWRSNQDDRIGRVAVNVSARQVLDSSMVATVQTILAETGMDPAALHLEVTETVFLDDAARAREVLTSLKELGVLLSLDDFGTGYSSLTYLKRLPFDHLKIDRALIADLGDGDETSRAIVLAVVELCRALGLTVIAEGVETVEQLRRVTDLGSELVQGFYFARPVEAAALEALVLAEPGRGPIRFPHPQLQSLS